MTTSTLTSVFATTSVHRATIQNAGSWRKSDFSSSKDWSFLFSTENQLVTEKIKEYPKVAPIQAFNSDIQRESFNKTV
jgi:hypothetical protein